MYGNPPGRAIRVGVARDILADPENTAFPFIYTLVPRSADTWESDKHSRTGSFILNMSGVGPQVLPGQTVDHVVILDNDFNFKLLWIRYTAYFISEKLVVPVYSWYWLGAPQVVPPYDYQRQDGPAATRYLRVGLTVTGPDGRYIYGAPSIYPTANTVNGEHPVASASMQGYDYGLGETNTEHLLPAGGMLRFRFTNTLPAGQYNLKMVVGALIYGMKVRI